MRKAIGRLLCLALLVSAGFGLLGGGSASAMTCYGLGNDVGVCYELDDRGAFVSSTAINDSVYLQVYGKTHRVGAGFDVANVRGGAFLVCYNGQFVVEHSLGSLSTPIPCPYL